MYKFKNYDGGNITVEDGKVKELNGNPLAIAKEIADVFNTIENGSSSLDFEGVLRFLEAQKEKAEGLFKDEFNTLKKEDISLNARRAYVLWEDITDALDLLKAGGGFELAVANFRDAMKFNNWENVKKKGNSNIVREAVVYTYKSGNDLSINHSVWEGDNETLAFAIAQSFRERLDRESCCKVIIALKDNTRTVYFNNDATVQIIDLLPDFKKLADRTLAEMVKGMELTFDATLFDNLVERTNSELARLENSGNQAYAQTYNALESTLFDVVFADSTKREVGFALLPFGSTESIKAQFNAWSLSFANYGVEFRAYEATGTSASVPIVVIKKMN